MQKIIKVLVFILLAIPSFAQREKGKLLKIPKLNSNKTETSANDDVLLNQPKDTQNEFDFTFEEEPKLRFSDSFESTVKVPASNSSNSKSTESSIVIEPLKELNEVIHDDTSSVTESNLVIVEVQESSRYRNENLDVPTGSYFSVWNNNSIDPYGIDPKKFNDVVPIRLYDIGQGRMWKPMLEETPITSHFGWRHGNRHYGTDIDLETGDPVYTTFDGVVRLAGTSGGYGRCVIVRHYNGIETLYGHMSKLYVSENMEVRAGDLIGLGGSTGRSSGSHLHFETRYEGNAFDSENIFSYANGQAQILSDQFVLTSAVFDYLRGGKSIVVDNSLDLPEEDQFNDVIENYEEEVPIVSNRKVYYQVRSGDNLFEIAKKFGLSVKELCDMNGISSRKRLYVGSRLRVK